LAEDIFFLLFSKALSNLKVTAVEISEYLKNIYASHWCTFRDKDEKYPGSFVVADGSYQSTAFQGGVRALCVRAIANRYEGNVLANYYPDVAVKLGFRLKRASLYMKALELKCLRRALNDCSDGSIAIHDGTIYPTISPKSLAGVTEQEVDAILEWLGSLYELYKFAMDHGHVLLGVVKDSHVNYLRSRILVRCIADVDYKLGEAISRERSLKNIASCLREALSASPNDALEEFLREAELMTSDEEVFEICTSEPGFTKPLLLAPQPLYLSEEVKAGTRNWRESRLRSRLESSSLLKPVSGVLDRIYSLPPILMFYWRPWHGYGVYRVDVASWVLNVGLRSDEMEGDRLIDDLDLVEKCRKIVSALNSLSPEPYAVKPLTDADELVRLRRSVYQESYEPVLIDYLRGEGLRAHPTKRARRETVLRGLK